MDADWLKDNDLNASSSGLEERVRAELDDREKLVWVGRPIAGRLAWETLPMFLFGIPFTLFAGFWLSSVLSTGKSKLPVALFGIPFVLMGLFLLSTPILAWFKAKKTCYALTDRRAIVVESHGGGQHVRSYTPQGLGSMARNQRFDGTGDLVFEELITSSGKNRRVIRRGFLAINDVRSVETLIRSILLN